MTTLNGQLCPYDGIVCFEGNCAVCETQQSANRKMEPKRGQQEGSDGDRS